MPSGSKEQRSENLTTIGSVADALDASNGSNLVVVAGVAGDADGADNNAVLLHQYAAWHRHDLAARHVRQAFEKMRTRFGLRFAHRAIRDNII
jgi:hypothetical protein